MSPRQDNKFSGNMRDNISSKPQQWVFCPPSTFSLHARTMHHSSRETRTQDIILSSILTRLGESSVVPLAVESLEGKENMMIATAVIIMFNIRYPYMKKANQIQWYGTSNSSPEPNRWFMWRFHCRAATALPIWIPSGGGGSNFGTENSASSVFI